MALLNLTGIEPLKYELLSDEETPAEGQTVLVPLSRFLEQRQTHLSSAGAIGVLIDTETPFADLEGIVDAIDFAVVAFPAFTDGRGFSLAVRLRKDYGFNGEIRATGPVIPDQAQFLARAGFDTVEIPEGRADAFKTAATRFKSFYQADFVGGRSVAHARHQTGAANTPTTGGRPEGQRKAS